MQFDTDFMLNRPKNTQRPKNSAELHSRVSMDKPFNTWAKAIQIPLADRLGVAWMAVKTRYMPSQKPLRCFVVQK